MNRSLLLSLPLATLAVCTGDALGVTENGSRICDSTRTALVAIDANYTLTSNSDKIIYAAGVNDSSGCRMRTGEGGHTLQYRVVAGSWATVPTSNGSGPFLASSGTSLSNNTTVSSSDRRANATGTGNFVAAGKEFTSSTNLDYATDCQDDHMEGQWALDFSTSPVSTTYEFRVQWGSKDCGTVNVTYSAQITTVAGGGGGASHHWDLDETSGTTAADSTDNGNDGTITDATWQSVISGSSQDQNGNGIPDECECPWDCGDGDGTVGIVDFLALLAQWGGPGSCDFDGGGVGINDFLELLGNWGPCP